MEKYKSDTEEVEVKMVTERNSSEIRWWRMVVTIQAGRKDFYNPVLNPGDMVIQHADGFFTTLPVNEFNKKYTKL